jgi:hypothetical protein
VNAAVRQPASRSRCASIAVRAGSIGCVAFTVPCTSGSCPDIIDRCVGSVNEAGEITRSNRTPAFASASIAGVFASLAP